MSGQRGLLVIVAGVIVLLAASVTVILVAGDRAPREYPAGSPEATLQTYLLAWEEGDFETAYAAFSQQARELVPFNEYRRQADDVRRWDTGPNGPARRVFIEEVTIGDDRATLDLTVEETWISGISTSRNTYGLAVRMVREDDGWRIDEPLLGLQPGYFGKY